MEINMRRMISLLMVLMAVGVGLLLIGCSERSKQKATFVFDDPTLATKQDVEDLKKIINDRFDQLEIRDLKRIIHDRFDQLENRLR